MSKNYDLVQPAGIGLSLDGSAARVERAISETANKQASATTRMLMETPPAIREESLKLIQRLFLANDQEPAKAVMFAAIDAGSGCSLLTAITARLLAENVSGSVCVVDGNFRTPPPPGMFAGENHYGLTDSLRREGAIRGFARQAGRDNLWLVSSGSPAKDPSNLLSGERMKERMAELRGEFSFVLIDAPPLNAYGDALAVGRLVDGVVLVLEANTTRREVALRISEKLQAANIRVLAAVLNKRTFPIPTVLYRWL
jgi:succinoglycan biosynthesis transport protein ExoP